MFEGIVSIGTYIDASPGSVVLIKINLVRRIEYLGWTFIETSSERVVDKFIGQIGTLKYTNSVLQISKIGRS